MNTYVDGVVPEHALNAPSAVPRDAPHNADPADRFADQMACFDHMREIDRAHRKAHGPIYVPPVKLVG